MTQTTHEVFTREDMVQPGADRSFGMVMAAVFAIVAAVNAWHGGTWWPWLCATAALFLACTFMRPALLRPLNVAWTHFGLVLHAIVNPLVMALLFYGTVLPTGLVMRALGRDLLRLRRDPSADTYWIARQPPGPAPDTFKDQF